MKFCGITTTFQRFGNPAQGRSFDDFYGDCTLKLRHRGMECEQNWIQTEWIWYSHVRPYFKLWPSIAPSALKIKFDVDCETFPSPPSPAMLLRFPDCGLTAGDQLRAVLFYVRPIEHKTLPEKSRQITVLSYRGRDQTPDFWGIIFRPGERVEEVIDRRLHPPKTIDQSTGEIRLTNNMASQVDMDGKYAAALRVVLFVLLLANDPSIIQPDVLSSDRQRFDESADPELRQRLIDKAKRRGIVGWRIGEQYETIPHYRRPHPALYHVGKGRKEQRIVFRAGSVVHRQKLTEVPTGWIDDDGTEVEP